MGRSGQSIGLASLVANSHSSRYRHDLHYSLEGAAKEHIWTVRYAAMHNPG